MPIMMLVIYGSIIAIMWFGGHMVDSGTLEIGLLTTFFTYVGQILVSLMMVSMIFMMLTRSVACGRRIVEVLDETPDINDDHCDTTARVKDGSIRFDHVYFKYDPNSPGGTWRISIWISRLGRRLVLSAARAVQNRPWCN